LPHNSAPDVRARAKNPLRRMAPNQRRAQVIHRTRRTAHSAPMIRQTTERRVILAEAVSNSAKSADRVQWRARSAGGVLATIGDSFATADAAAVLSFRASPGHASNLPSIAAIIFRSARNIWRLCRRRRRRRRRDARPIGGRHSNAAAHALIWDASAGVRLSRISESERIHRSPYQRARQARENRVGGGGVRRAGITCDAPDRRLAPRTSAGRRRHMRRISISARSSNHRRLSSLAGAP